MVLGAGALGAALLRRPGLPTSPPQKASVAASAPATVHAEAAEVHLLDRIEPVSLAADAAGITPIGASPVGAAEGTSGAGPGHLASWATSSPAAAAALPPELTRPFPPAIEPAGATQTVSHAPLASQAAATTIVFHEVRDGDTLAQLAQRYLGHSDRYLEIYEANRDQLGHPDVLPLGSKLKIPVPRTDEPVAGAPTTDRLVPLTP